MVSRETPILTLERCFQHLPPTLVSLFKHDASDNIRFNFLSELSVWLHFNKLLCPLVCVCSSLEEAELVYQTSYLLNPDRLYFFPESSSLSSSVPGFISEHQRYKEEAINALINFDGIIVTTQTAVDESAIPLTSDSGMTLTEGSKISMGVLVDRLLEWGYSRVEKTNSPNTYSIRGGILDVFLQYSKYPVRVEFFGSNIESIRTYNPVSQRSVSSIKHIDVSPPSDYFKDNVEHRSLFDVLSENIFKCFVNSNGGKWSLSTKPFSDNGVLFSSIAIEEKDLQFLSEPPRPKGQLIIFIENESQLQTLKNKTPENALFVLGVLQKSFRIENVLFLSGNELAGRTPSVRTRWETEHIGSAPISSLLSLSEGDYLVHRDYGIGRYQGLSVLKSKFGEQECIKIEYSDNAAVHVPLDKFSRVHRYIGRDKESVSLSTLGSPRWKNEKKRVVSATSDIVQSLVRYYKERSSARGFVYSKNDLVYRSVVRSFPYDETTDQTSAISAVVADMEKDRPMDRLVCGDVGFGKTEVALRATTKAVMSGKKVLILAPTTILADQHYITFMNRLGSVGIRTELLSRFRSKSQQRKILEKMITEELDVVIGTHRLLSTDVIFPNLGLIIVDEEHRFGVKHKERLRELKQSLDVLTLTATPIPRTLQQSLVGIKDLSVINTPPKTRKPIHTTVGYFNWSVIEKVVNSELLRNGQVYFLHNDVQALPFYLEELQMRFPDASIVMAHGQMLSSRLEKAILAFFSGEVDILLCTTIIESGLDVANANTIIVNQAHNFGLSQLYQIRGRVGRGFRQAHCYLFIPPQKKLSGDAYQRLKALEHFTSLGSGYNIALRDLEIRGAGNLFGTKQSGHMAKVGFELYCKLLEEAAEEQIGVEKKQKSVPSITLHAITLLDDDYMPLIQDRLYFYQRLSSCDTFSSYDDIVDELVDRFGSPTLATKTLLRSVKLRIGLLGSGVSSMSVTRGATNVVFKSFEPFESFSDLTSRVDVCLQPSLHPYRFHNIKPDSFELKINTPSFGDSLKIAEDFVKLFSV